MTIKKEQLQESKILCKNTIQITLDDDFNVPDTKSDIEMVVKEWGNVFVDSVNLNGDKAEIKGGLDFAVLYTGKKERDNTVAPVKMSGNMSYSEIVNLSIQQETVKIYCDANIEDLTIKAINSRKISVKALITLTVTCVDEQWINLGNEIGEVAEGDNIQVKKEKLEYTELVVDIKDNFRIKENVSIPQSKPNIGELLWDEVSVKSFNCRVTDDGIMINGELGVFIMYDSETENQGIIWYETAATFDGEIPVSGSSIDMISFVKYRIMNTNVEVKPNYDGEMRDINIEIVLEMRVKGYMEKETDIITDIYSPNKKVELDRNKVNISHLLTKNTSKCKANLRTKMDDNSNIMQICNCSGMAQIDNVDLEEDGLSVDGAVLVNVFYLTTRENVPMASKKIAVPFSNKIQLKTSDEMDYDMDVYVESINAVMTGKDEIEIKGNVAIEAICFENSEKETVNECHFKEYDENEFLKIPSLVGYISDGKTSLWDIAKKYHTTVDLIRMENKNLPEHCDVDYKIRKKEKLLLIKAAL